MIKFPDFNDAQTVEEKFELLVEYLWQYHKELEHQFQNLSADNFNESTLKELAQLINEEGDENDSSET